MAADLEAAQAARRDDAVDRALADREVMRHAAPGENRRETRPGDPGGAEGA